MYKGGEHWKTPNMCVVTSMRKRGDRNNGEWEWYVVNMGGMGVCVGGG